MAGNNGSRALSFYAIIATTENMRLSKRIQQEFPEIADSYRDDSSISGLVDNYDIVNRYGVDRNVARGVVWLALNGLIGVDEMERIGEKHRSDNGKTAVARLKNEKIGLEFLESDDLVELARRGGITARDKKKGLFGRTSEKHSTDSKKAGRNSAKKRGQVPWKDEEAAFAYLISKDYTWEEVRGELNDRFHGGDNVRETPDSVFIGVYRFKKRLGNGKTAKQ